MKQGDIFQTKKHSSIEVVEFLDSRNVMVRFVNTGWALTVRADSIRTGNIRDRMSKTAYGMGYLGVEDFSPHPLYKNLYDRWKNMFKRCYDTNLHKKHPSYVGCVVSEEWHDLSNFIKWCINRPDLNGGKWELDKDILIKGNKIYGPETCCFVPSEINNLFVKRQAVRGKFPIGVTQYTKNRYRDQCQDNEGNLVRFGLVCSIEEAFEDYKTFKESVIKGRAEKYKDALSDPTYQALINYQVEFDD